ncbi:MAG: hypothetical protein PUE88_03500, partial [Ruminococcus sp.]|nr:hypothetical protein [Ruminococcus sp.]
MNGEQHFPIFPRFQIHQINTFVKDGSLPSLTILLAELSQLDRISPAARCLQPISKNNSNKKAEYVFSVLCFCLLCDIR